MKALTFQGPYQLSFESVLDPAIEQPSDAVVRVELGAICGSDLHVYRGHERGLEPGTVMGHEFIGEVVATGRGVQRFSTGSKVIAPFTTSCGLCFYCTRGLTCRCAVGQLFGWVEHGHGLHGAQAEYVRVPHADATLVEMPAGVPDEHALLCGDVLATGLYCADLADIESDSVVAIVGCGPVGLMAVLGARECGAKRVFAIDSVAERLQLASEFGAETINFQKDDPRERLRAATDGRGADCVLEVVGSPAASRAAFELARPGGTVAACGVHTESTFAFSPVEAYDKNLTYRAGRCPARHYLPRAVDLVASRKYDLGRIVSHRLPLAEGARGYRLFDEKKEACTKVLLTG